MTKYDWIIWMIILYVLTGLVGPHIPGLSWAGAYSNTAAISGSTPGIGDIAGWAWNTFTFFWALGTFQLVGGEVISTIYLALNVITAYVLKDDIIEAVKALGELLPF